MVYTKHPIEDTFSPVTVLVHVSVAKVNRPSPSSLFRCSIPADSARQASTVCFSCVRPLPTHPHDPPLLSGDLGCAAWSLSVITWIFQNYRHIAALQLRIRNVTSPCGCCTHMDFFARLRYYSSVPNAVTGSAVFFPAPYRKDAVYIREAYWLAGAIAVSLYQLCSSIPYSYRNQPLGVTLLGPSTPCGRSHSPRAWLSYSFQRVQPNRASPLHMARDIRVNRGYWTPASGNNCHLCTSHVGFFDLLTVDYTHLSKTAETRPF